MRRIYAFALSEWQHVLKDRVAILMLIFLPLVFTVVLSLVFGGAGNAPLRIGLVAGDSGLTDELTRALGQEHGLTVTLVSRAEAEARLKRASLDAALIVPPNMQSNDGLQVMTDPSTERGYQAYTRLIGVQAAVSGRMTAKALGKEVLPTAADVAKAETAYAASALPSVRVVQGWKPVAEGVVQVSPGMLVMFILMFAAYSGEGIVLERNNGTLRRLFASPVSGWQYLVGRMVGKVSLGMLQFLLLAAFGAWVLRVNWGATPGQMIITGLIFSCASAAFGLLLGMLCRTPDQLSAAATIVCLALAALGGTWWPIDVAPGVLQAIGHVLPTGMAMTALHALILQGADGIVSAHQAWLGLLAWGAGFLCIGALLFRAGARNKMALHPAHKAALK